MKTPALTVFRKTQVHLPIW